MKLVLEDMPLKSFLNLFELVLFKAKIGAIEVMYRDGDFELSGDKPGSILLPIMLNFKCLYCIRNRLFSSILCVFLNIGLGHAQWVKTDGSFRGNVTSLAVSGGAIFASSDQFGVYRTLDGGTSWIRVTNGLTTLLVWELAVKGNMLFAGTERGGIFRSADNGDSWTKVNNGLADTSVFAFLAKGEDLFAGTRKGVFRTSDNGDSWTKVGTGLPDTTVLALADDGSHLYAGGSGFGVYRSSDNGSSWTSSSVGMTHFWVHAFGISGGDILAGTQNGGVFRSSDSGAFWRPANSGLTDTLVESFYASGSHLFVGTVFGRVCRSVDQGSTWIPVAAGLVPISVDALAVSGDHLYAGTYGGGVWKRPLSEMSVTGISTRQSASEFGFGKSLGKTIRPGVGIELTVAHRSLVELSLHDMNGRKAWTSGSSILAPGTHWVAFDGRGLSHGVHVLRLRAGELTRTRRILLEMR